MPNEQLANKISTPSVSVLKDFEEHSEIVLLDGKKIQTLFLGEGGFGKTYLYKDEAKQEYRVAKVFHKGKETELGDIERRIASFNSIYNKLYNKELSSLATARLFNENRTILDMPYIGGIDYFCDTDREEVRTNKILKLLAYFRVNEFFVSDYDLPGNIMFFIDPASNKKYFLIRDVDLVGRKDSYDLHGEESVTSEILKYQTSTENDIDVSEFRRVVTSNNKDDHEAGEYKEKETKTPEILEKFIYIKSLLLKSITPKHIKYNMLANAKDFQELCFIAAQKRKKNFFSKDEGFTGVLDKLHDLLKKENEKFKVFKLPLQFTKFDLQEIGFYGEMHTQDDNYELRQKNLQYIYSVQHDNNQEFKSHITQLQKYSLFLRDFRTIPIKTAPVVPVKPDASVLKKKS